MLEVKFPILRSNRLLLRQLVENDLENVFKGLSHPDVIKYYGVNFSSLEATKEQMKWFTDLELNETGIWWAVCSADGQTFFGAGGLNDLSIVQRKAEIGFWLLPAYWEKGIMTEAIPLICNYAFEKLQVDRVEGSVETENRNCKRGLAKLNFLHEQTMVDHEVKNGSPISLDIYSKMKEGKFES